MSPSAWARSASPVMVPSAVRLLHSARCARRKWCSSSPVAISISTGRILTTCATSSSESPRSACSTTDSSTSAITRVPREAASSSSACGSSAFVMGAFSLGSILISVMAVVLLGGSVGENVGVRPVDAGHGTALGVGGATLLNEPGGAQVGECQGVGLVAAADHGVRVPVAHGVDDLLLGGVAMAGGPELDRGGRGDGDGDTGRFDSVANHPPQAAPLVRRAVPRAVGRPFDHDQVVFAEQ